MSEKELILLRDAVDRQYGEMRSLAERVGHLERRMRHLEGGGAEAFSGVVASIGDLEDTVRALLAYLCIPPLHGPPVHSGVVPIPGSHPSTTAR